jgi:Mor family transcriptional regulator
MLYKGDAMISNQEICDIIDSFVRGRNAERNRALLKRRLIDGVTLERLAEEFDMSVTQIKDIIRRNLSLVKDHLSI